MEFNHTSVLLNECIEGLNIKKNGIYVDGTLGGAGHAIKICSHLDKTGIFVGIDQDNNALETSKSRLANNLNKTYIIKSNFNEIETILNNINIDKIDGMLLDLGVSSYQLDEAERGFSYMKDANLDMRMNQDVEFSAFDVVNNYSEDDLSKVIKNFGEEKWAKRIANFIVQARPVYTTFQLVEIIKNAIPKSARVEGGHPAKRTFQAIRIEVNKEIDIIAPAINKIVEKLNLGGRLCIITFHSLEDRIVKHKFKELENPCICPSNFPICNCNRQSQIKILTRKPILPSEQELAQNSRSKSAKLRIVEKII
ncbi:16S rRNA (cytosine(1402)-N(4))-methyltransferase [Candidatus Epulonipiscioides gigas]|nr:16S rRNA (cytosine(1402)-N(4))-methyltransferase [Epulopiscium sp. SCG-C07WGA-EpuloA2]